MWEGGEGLTVLGKFPTEFETIRNYEMFHEELAGQIVSLISGYVHKGDFESAFRTFRSVVHAYTEKVGHNLDVPLRSLIIDMYCKCESLGDATLIFEGGKDTRVALWTSMISGLPANGRGLLEEGRGYFELVRKVYGIKPGIEHFACMVGLYGRRGRLDEIKQFIYQNGISNVTSVWTTILSSFRLHRNVELGKWTWEELLRLFPNDSTPYVLLSNICADEGRWTEAANISSQIRKRRLKKVPGQSWI
ncbi:pentatricopeptide repeat-containing protein At1g74630-like [Punica granatum]|uniref:Pentatricopeptide repeat-containing protein At1g74630-like n=1 Tax=Punica granatum TaxID=22663 RepID=A0A6P8CTA9_PUNGR|nr:pentatricopeptide repeat-containing protein At1g74630-like [Punica granatum]